MPAPVVSLCNLKGGVGKSSTTFHAAGTFAADSRRVLVIDADPQASITQAFFGPDGMRAMPRHETIAGLFGDGIPPDPADLVRATGFANLAILPGSGHFTRHNVPEPWRADREDQLALREFTREVRDDFDLILIDCPPNLHLAAWSALAASDALVVPLQAEDFGSQGIASILDCVDAIHAGPNPALRLAGYLLTMFNPRLAIHKAYESTLRQIYGADVFEVTIPIGADFKEAVAIRKPIIAHKPRGASSKSIRAFVAELLARLDCTVQGHVGEAA